MASRNAHHKIVIVGGGSAGISVAARLLRAGETDVAVIDPAEVHYYQPLWTLAGGGRAPAGESARVQAAVMPPGATWIREAATEIDPDGQAVGLASGATVGYDFLVVCPGLALDWDRLPGAAQTLGRGGVSSNYQFDLAPKTWEFIKGMRSGTAVFTMPSGPIKCAEMVLVNRQGGGEEKSALPYDMAHLVPPQSAPAWIKAGPLADPANPGGYVQIDKATMRHARYGNVFSLGDAGSSPNSKTGAAIRKQAPVVVSNLRAVMAGREPAAAYDGYASCPLTTARNRMLLAEFDYTMKPHPTIPLIDTKKERYDMWLLKRYGLPFLYWNLMLKGRA